MGLNVEAANKLLNNVFKGGTWLPRDQFGRSVTDIRVSTTPVSSTGTGSWYTDAFTSIDTWPSASGGSAASGGSFLPLGTTTGSRGTIYAVGVFMTGANLPSGGPVWFYSLPSPRPHVLGDSYGINANTLTVTIS